MKLQLIDYMSDNGINILNNQYFLNNKIYYILTVVNGDFCLIDTLHMLTLSLLTPYSSLL